MNTDSRRKASAAYHAKRKDAGLLKVTVWLSAEARARLDELKALHGSKDAAVEALLAARATPMPAKVAKASSAPEKRLGVDVQLGPSPVVPGSRLKKR